MTTDSHASTTYKRLAGRGHRGRALGFLFSRCHLFLGSDHILSVESTGYTERYKRFYFDDIGAILTEETTRGNAWKVVLLVLVMFWTGLAYVLGSGTGRIVTGSLAAISLLALIVHFVRGPTCRCFIYTAVQKEELPSLNRVWVAEKVIARLKSLIEAAQGVVDPEVLAAQVADPRVAGDLPEPQTHAAESVVIHNRVRHYDGTMHLIAFLLLLVDGLLSVLSLIHHVPLLAFVSIPLSLTYSILIVVALVRQQGTDVPPMVRTVAWIVTGFAWLSLMVGNVVGSMMAVYNGRMITNQWNLQQEMLKLSPHDSLFVLVLSIVNVACSFGLGVPGVMGVLRHRRAFATQEGEASGEVRPQ
jgi:hypothetical protein